MTAVTLPTDPVSVLAGRHEAAMIAAELNAAFWLHGRDNGTALFLLNEAHMHLAQVAKAMGYTITPIAAATVEDDAA